MNRATKDWIGVGKGTAQEQMLDTEIAWRADTLDAEKECLKNFMSFGAEKEAVLPAQRMVEEAGVARKEFALCENLLWNGRVEVHHCEGVGC